MPTNTLSATAQNVIMGNLQTTSISSIKMNLMNSNITSAGSPTIPSITAGTANATSYVGDVFATLIKYPQTGTYYNITVLGGLIVDVEEV